MFLRSRRFFGIEPKSQSERFQVELHNDGYITTERPSVLTRQTDPMSVLKPPSCSCYENSETHPGQSLVIDLNSEITPLVSVKCILPFLTSSDFIRISHGADTTVIARMMTRKNTTPTVLSIGLSDIDGKTSKVNGPVGSVWNSLGEADMIPLELVDTIPEMILANLMVAPRSSFGWGRYLIREEELLDSGICAPTVQFKEGSFCVIPEGHPLLSLTNLGRSQKPRAFVRAIHDHATSETNRLFGSRNRRSASFLVLLYALAAFSILEYPKLAGACLLDASTYGGKVDNGIYPAGTANHVFRKPDMLQGGYTNVPDMYPMFLDIVPDFTANGIPVCRIMGCRRTPTAQIRFFDAPDRPKVDMQAFSKMVVDCWPEGFEIHPHWLKFYQPPPKPTLKPPANSTTFLLNKTFVSHDTASKFPELVEEYEKKMSVSTAWKVDDWFPDTQSIVVAVVLVIMLLSGFLETVLKAVASLLSLVSYVLNGKAIACPWKAWACIAMFDAVLCTLPFIALIKGFFEAGNKRTTNVVRLAVVKVICDQIPPLIGDSITPISRSTCLRQVVCPIKDNIEKPYASELIDYKVKYVIYYLAMPLNLGNGSVMLLVAGHIDDPTAKKMMSYPDVELRKSLHLPDDDSDLLLHKATSLRVHYEALMYDDPVASRNAFRLLRDCVTKIIRN